jgi:NADPH:quinone reductase-like Zn-dependent oxidoreductase
MYTRVAAVEPGQRVLIHGGSGAVGSALLQLGEALDLEMVTTASERSLDVLEGIDMRVIDYTAPDYTRQLRDAAGEGFDAVFDMVGPTSYVRSYRLLHNHGTLVAYGFTGLLDGVSRRTVRTQLRSVSAVGLAMGTFALVNARPDGRSASFYDVRGRRSEHPEEFASDLRTVLDMVADG